jgi:DNA-3-methyladenine glycosylase
MNFAPYLSDALTAARTLLGWKLIHITAEGKTSGYIVETEAYHEDDPASHAFGGPRGRNLPMFETPGTIYVYFTYGMHYCVNIVAGKKGRGEAVLIRALEPLEGITLMHKRRGITDKYKLTNGPAKLVRAMGIDTSLNGTMINSSQLFLESGLKPRKIIQTTRIGITKASHEPWRFYIASNSYVSKRVVE